VRLRVGIWTIEPLYLLAVGLTVVFVTGMWTADNLSASMRNFTTAFAVSLVASVPLHEWGHVLVARRRGFPVEEVLVGRYSGALWSAGEREPTVTDAIAISAAGPASNACAALAAAILLAGSDLSQATLAGVVLAMLMASLLDLIPLATPVTLASGQRTMRMSDGAVIRHAWRQRG
jgi:Zn-dependent protease